jgi:hypothetical protein
MVCRHLASLYVLTKTKNQFEINYTYLCMWYSQFRFNAYNRKMTQAGEACRTAGLVFIPMPMETLGGWHEQTVDQVRKIGSALARHTGQEESEAIRHLGQRLSVLLAKGNAALILNRVPTFPDPEIDGVH